MDVFTDELFRGNPAAVCILAEWLPTAVMQSIAAENNLSETAFLVPLPDAYELRWFTPVEEVLLATDVIAVLPSESHIAASRRKFPDLETPECRGVIATAAGRRTDFSGRCFYPKLGVKEAPVTGSAYCQPAPYWGERIDRNEPSAEQLSRRGGSITCEIKGERGTLSGRAVT